MDETTPEKLKPFIREGRLLRLPAKWERKKAALAYIAGRSFQAGRAYSEREVNERLAGWASGNIDHVTLRRYLVDLRHLVRDNDGCTYWVP